MGYSFVGRREQFVFKNFWYNILFYWIKPFDWKDILKKKLITTLEPHKLLKYSHCHHAAISLLHYIIS